MIDPVEAERYRLMNGLRIHEPAGMKEGTLIATFEQFGKALRKAGFTKLLDLTPVYTRLELEQRLKQRREIGTYNSKSALLSKAFSSWWQQLFN